MYLSSPKTYKMEKVEHLIQSFCPYIALVRPRRLSKHKASMWSAKVSKGRLFLTVCVETLILSLLLIPNQVPVASTVGPVWGPRGAIAAS